MERYLLEGVTIELIELWIIGFCITLAVSIYRNGKSTNKAEAFGLIIGYAALLILWPYNLIKRFWLDIKNMTRN